MLMHPREATDAIDSLPTDISSFEDDEGYLLFKIKVWPEVVRYYVQKFATFFGKEHKPLEKSYDALCVQAYSNRESTYGPGATLLDTGDWCEAVDLHFQRLNTELAGKCDGSLHHFLSDGIMEITRFRLYDR